jgi:catechol 2,3-dioxygenase-like lactoylglutathione lyase family enzyme
VQLQSLDFLYVPTADVDEAARGYVDDLGAELVWLVRAMGTEVACLRVSEAGPRTLLSGHLEGEAPILIYRVAQYAAAVAELRAAGAEIVLPVQGGGTRSGVHFRAPDGFLYELAEDRSA